ncbi:hypothetical protein F4824DRAFT_158136 [Ustulina deusta]|nr:hypothetical protein F4824DRAFT_158136 [Ustulina deusta]
MKTTLALVALAAGISHVTATGFHDAPSFSCPDNSNNQCTSDMTTGFDWSDLAIGGFGSYKGFTYSGYTCSQKFGKRDELTGRSFQSKCITGKATQDKDTSAKITCDQSQGVEKTSISEFQVTPEFDCDLEFHYTMPDGSTCKHRSSCKASGTTVKNTQCGGATDVTVVYPSQPDKSKDSCDYGIHSIGFDCSGPKPTTTKYHTSPVSTPTYPANTPSYPDSSSTAAASSPSSYPVGSPSSPASQTSSTPAGPVETLPCPGVVPSCLNTWMFAVGCKDNTDSACYCPDNDFVNNIFACLYAHGESDEVISEAISYFQGICAPFVPSNPGIATGAETITTVLTVTPTSIASYTTISVIATTVVPCTNDVGEVIPSSSSTVVISTAMTVPQVVFTTYPATGSETSAVAVVPGTYPAATPAPTSAGVSVPYPTGSAITTFTTSPSAGGYPVSTPATTSPIATAGASRIGAGLGFLGMVAMVVAAL